MNEEFHQTERDLLIEIKTTVFSNGAKLSEFILETKSTLEKHQKDIDFLNRLVYGFIGVIAFLEFIFKVIR